MLEPMACSVRTAAPAGVAAAVAIASAFPVAAPAEQASRPTSPSAGGLDVGRFHACAVLSQGSVRCWGFGGGGLLGYGAENTIGDDETPAAAGPVDLGAGRTAVGLSVGAFHACAVLDDGTVRCWGFGGDGRLGYANTAAIGDDETPGSAGPVNLGAGRTAKALTAGRAHSCAVLDDGTVRCWGFGFDGRLGYGNQDSIGDDETPGSVRPGRHAERQRPSARLRDARSHGPERAVAPGRARRPPGRHGADRGPDPAGHRARRARRDGRTEAGNGDRQVPGQIRVQRQAREDRRRQEARGEDPDGLHREGQAHRSGLSALSHPARGRRSRGGLGGCANLRAAGDLRRCARGSTPRDRR